MSCEHIVPVKAWMAIRATYGSLGIEKVELQYQANGLTCDGGGWMIKTKKTNS